MAAESDRRRVPGTLWMALALVALLWAVALAALGVGVPDPRDDLWEYGVVARHLIAGEGFRTTVIHPPVWSLRAPSGSVAMWVHGPLIPLVLVPWIQIGGEGALDHAAWLGAGLVLLAAWFAGRAALRHGGAGAGASTLIVVALSPLLWSAAVHDLSMAAGALAIAIALDQAWRERPRGVTAGVALGIGALARPELLFAGLASMLILARGQDRIRTLIGLALPTAAVWIVRAFGALPARNLSELLVVCYTARWPELSALRDFHLTPGSLGAAIREAAPGLGAKWAHQGPRALFHLLSAPCVAVAPLMVLGLIRGWTSSGRPAKVGLLLLAAIPISLITLTESSARYVMPWVPLAAVASVAGAREILRRTRMSPSIASVIPVLLTVPFAATSLATRAQEVPRLRAAIEAERVALRPLDVVRTRERSPFFSDRPDFDAWITGRSVVWLERHEFDRLPPADSTESTRAPRRAPETLGWFHDAPLGPGRFVGADLRSRAGSPSIRP